MFLKNLILLFLILSPVFKIKSNQTSKLTNLAAVVSAPIILKQLTNSFVDSDDHLNSVLLSLTCGNAIASFDQLASLDPKMRIALLDTLKNAVSLYLLDFCYEYIRKERFEKNEDKAQRNIADIFELGLIDETLIGRFTKYFLIYKTFNLVLSKIFTQFKINEIMSKYFDNKV